LSIRICKREVAFGVVEYPFCGGEVAVYSRRCPGKETDNEDGALWIELCENQGILAVADGMGGHSGGDRAAETVLDAIANNCDGMKNPDPSMRSRIVDAFESANRQIIDWGIGAGSTIVAAEVLNNVVRIIHVGDSTGLLCSNRGRIKYQTVAHSPVAQAVELGILDEQSALLHEGRNIIDNHVGDAAMRIEVGPTIEMAKRDTLMLASDGLFDNLTPTEIVEFMRTGQLFDQLTTMTDEVQLRMNGQSASVGKPDDCTVIAFRRR